VANRFKIVDARWTERVNMLKVRCPNCKHELEHPANRTHARCPNCGQRGPVDKSLAG
jgi:ribosomal protein S27E